MSEKIIVSYENVVSAVDHITNQIIESGNIPDVIVGLTRGGLIPAVMLSHRLKLPMKTIQWSTRDYPLKESLDELRIYRKILIVDDICDSGVTLNGLLYDLNVVAPITKVETAVIALKHTQSYHPNYHWMSIYPHDCDRWVEFFWEFNA